MYKVVIEIKVVKNLTIALIKILYVYKHHMITYGLKWVIRKVRKIKLCLIGYLLINFDKF